MMRWKVYPVTENEVLGNWEVISYTEEVLRTNEMPYQYMLGRGLTDETLQDFHVGYFPPNLDIEGITQQAGTADAYSPLSRRITIPTFDSFGVPISIVGRKLDNSTSRFKMLPIPYQKSKYVYNLHQAKYAIRKKQFVYVVEGQVDVMSLWQKGIRNCVCMQGTGASFKQLCLLARYTGNVIYIKDNDQGGDKSVEAFEKSIASLMNKFSTNTIIDMGYELDTIHFNVEYECPPADGKDVNDALVAGNESFFEYLRGIQVVDG